MKEDGRGKQLSKSANMGECDTLTSCRGCHGNQLPECHSFHPHPPPSPTDILVFERRKSGGGKDTDAHTEKEKDVNQVAAGVKGPSGGSGGMNG